MEQNRKAIHFAVTKRADRLGSDIAGRKSRSPCRDDDLDPRIIGPASNPILDRFDIVDDDRPCGKRVSSTSDPVGQQRTRFVGRLGSRIRYREYRDLQRMKCETVVNSGHAHPQRSRES